MFNIYPCGYEFQSDEYIVFFGNKQCDLDVLKDRYPHIEFRTVRQTHSDIVISSEDKSDQIEADAHWTQDSNVGLVIKTADCIPIMIFDHEKKRSISIHAGWKGVENQIALKTLKKIESSQNLIVYLGPCIHQKSFQVDEDVYQLLAKSSFLKKDPIYFFEKNKYWIDLLKIVKSQISHYAPEAQIYDLNIDTFQDEQFNSFRKNKTNIRNLSFIAMKSNK